jgi:hypothetical protein
MHELASERLQSLREELATAERLEQQLVVQRAHVRERMVRVAGAIEVLEELLRADGHQPADTPDLRRAAG